MSIHVIAENDTTVHVTLNDLPTSVGYTIFWCENNKSSSRCNASVSYFTDQFLPPASAVEVIESEPSFCVSVCEHSYGRTI